MHVIFLSSPQNRLPFKSKKKINTFKRKFLNTENKQTICATLTRDVIARRPHCHDGQKPEVAGRRLIDRQVGYLLFDCSWPVVVSRCPPSRITSRARHNDDVHVSKTSNENKSLVTTFTTTSSVAPHKHADYGDLLFRKTSKQTCFT